MLWCVLYSANVLLHVLAYPFFSLRNAWQRFGEIQVRWLRWLQRVHRELLCPRHASAERILFERTPDWFHSQCVSDFIWFRFKQRPVFGLMWCDFHRITEEFKTLEIVLTSCQFIDITWQQATTESHWRFSSVTALLLLSIPVWQRFFD